MLCSKVRTIKKPYPTTNKNQLNKLYKIKRKMGLSFGGVAMVGGKGYINRSINVTPYGREARKGVRPERQASGVLLHFSFFFFWFLASRNLRTIFFSP